MISVLYSSTRMSIFSDRYLHSYCPHVFIFQCHWVWASGSLMTFVRHGSTRPTTFSAGSVHYFHISFPSLCSSQNFKIKITYWPTETVGRPSESLNLNLQVLSGNAILSAFIPFAANPLFRMIYNASLETTPAAVMFLAASIMILTAMGNFFIFTKRNWFKKYAENGGLGMEFENVKDEDMKKEKVIT